MQDTKFKNKTFQTFLKQHHVHHFVTYNKTKAQVVERFNRTLKQMMWRLFTTGSSYHYLDKINDIVNSNYNQTFHTFLIQCNSSFFYQPTWQRNIFLILIRGYVELIINPVHLIYRLFITELRFRKVRVTILLLIFD